MNKDFTGTFDEVVDKPKPNGPKADAKPGAGTRAKSNGRGDSMLPPAIQSSAEFIANFVPPDYLWDGILQRRFIYTLTAPTGAGKTAIALLLAAKVALGQPVAGREVQRGRAVILAGENADDVRMRWLAMAQSMGFDPGKIDVYFIEGTFSLSGFAISVASQISALGGAQLIIVDTSAAYFEGAEENSNVELGNHARLLRGFTRCAGEPAVLVLCHPTKNATAENMLPRGGGAFLAEVDGNLTTKVTDFTIELHWQGKLRGPGFEPVAFELVPVTADRLKDSRGRAIFTVLARDLTSAEAETRAAQTVSAEDRILIALDMLERPSVAALAEHLGWFTTIGEPQKSKVHRTLKRLAELHLVAKGRGDRYELTSKGEGEALKVTKKY